MKPQDFLTYAEGIAGSNAFGPAEYRSAISRAYYAVYLAARDWLRAHGIKIVGGNEHQKLKVFLLECKVDAGAELARLLDILQQSRKEADYDLHLTHVETQRASQLAVQRAADIQAAMAKCATMSAQIVAGIQEYRQKTNQ